MPVQKQFGHKTWPVHFLCTPNPGPLKVLPDYMPGFVEICPLIPEKKIFEVFLARLYESTGRAIAVTPASVSASALASSSALLKMLKFLVEFL